MSLHGGAGVPVRAGAARTAARVPARPGRARRAVLAAVAVGLAAWGGPAAASPAAAAPASEVYPVPAARVLTVDGYGYGHGRGLSQWGAQGAATLGVPAERILATYYPGTVATVLPGAPIRIALTGLGKEGRLPTAAGAGDGRYECDSASSSAPVRCRLEVVPAAGLTVSDATSGARQTLPTTVAGLAVTGWRVLNTGAALQLQALTSGWVDYRVQGRAPSRGPVTFGGTHPSVRYLDGSVRTYRGTVSAVWTGATRVVRVNEVGLEKYLRSVVPQEAPPTWRPAALQAQAVAARSFSAASRVARRGQLWHLCDSNACQVYAGTTLVPPGRAPVPQELGSTDAAISATRASVRTYAGAVVRAEFGSSNGGWSVSGGVPWLPARADPWDGVLPGTTHSWQAQLPAAPLEARFGLARLDELVVLSRDGRGALGGRVLTVELRGVTSTGVATTVRTTGAAVSAAAGLRSPWFQPRE